MEICFRKLKTKIEFVIWFVVVCGITDTFLGTFVFKRDLEATTLRFNY